MVKQTVYYVYIILNYIKYVGTMFIQIASNKKACMHL